MITAVADTDLSNPRFARFLTFASTRGETREVRAARREALAGLTGTVVEVGSGAGVAFELYPPTVERLVAVEPEVHLRATATAAASSDGRIEVVPGDAEHLPLEDGTADAVVFGLVLCSVPDQRAALREARRVLKPGGEVRLFEHVAAEHPVGARLQRAVDATFWPHAFGGCHTHRDTLRALQDEGFDTSDVQRRTLPLGLPVLPCPHLVGTARA